VGFVPAQQAQSAERMNAQCPSCQTMDAMPARKKPKNLGPEMVTYVRRRYAAGDPVGDILADTRMLKSDLYQCLDGLLDDGSGLLVAPLPRRLAIKRRRVGLPQVRATVAARLWRTAEGHVKLVEARLARNDLSDEERERDVRVIAVIAQAARDLVEADCEARPAAALAAAPMPASAPTSENDDSVPDDIDEFRRHLAEKLDRLAAAHAAGASGKS
jgi:hypothetical protein